MMLSVCERKSVVSARLMYTRAFVNIRLLKLEVDSNKSPTVNILWIRISFAEAVEIAPSFNRNAPAVARIRCVCAVQQLCAGELNLISCQNKTLLCLCTNWIHSVCNEYLEQLIIDCVSWEMWSTTMENIKWKIKNKSFKNSTKQSTFVYF